MNPDKLFSLLSPKQVLSQESQQAYQSKVDTAKAENKMIKEKVVNPFFSFADKSFKKIMEVLNPGESYVAPALKKIGVNPILAGGIGLGVDILAPGPGELGRVAKVGKEVKAGSELLQEAKKYKSAEEFVNLPKNKTEQIARINDLVNTNKDTEIIAKIGNREFVLRDIKSIEPDFVEIPTSRTQTGGMVTKKEYKINFNDGTWDRMNNPSFAISTKTKSQLTDIFNKAHNIKK